MSFVYKCDMQTHTACEILIMCVVNNDMQQNKKLSDHKHGITNGCVEL